MNEPKTVRVRIAVAVGADGNFSASGWKARHAVDERTMLETALDSLEGDADLAWARHWIEADVPLPLAPQTVEGVVTPAQEE